MPQLDFTSYLPQVFWLVVTFAALYLIMWKVAVPGIADVLESRQKRIADNLDKAAEAKKEAEETLAAYEKTMSEARSESQAMIAEAAQQMSKEAAERESKLADDLNGRIATSEANIDKAIQDAMVSVQAVATEVAAAAVERLTGEAASESDLAKAIENAGSNKQ
ncbi:MAG: F0F1 ATP synthase subunit B' [Rhodospirillales bacterium]